MLSSFLLDVVRRSRSRGKESNSDEEERLNISAAQRLRMPTPPFIILPLDGREERGVTEQPLLLITLSGERPLSQTGDRVRRKVRPPTGG